MTKSTKKAVAAVDEGGDSSLYDCGLGHISVKGMKVLLSKGKLSGVKSIDLGLGEDCIFKKQKMSIFPRPT
jgi:hypothetical protein